MVYCKYGQRTALHKIQISVHFMLQQYCEPWLAVSHGLQFNNLSDKNQISHNSTMSQQLQAAEELVPDTDRKLQSRS